ncbi:VOC family protein [Actinocorallia aurea]
MGRGEGVRAGTPCWLELTARDPQEAVHFYGALFEWRLEYDEASGYGTFFRGGASVAGLWPEPTSGAAADWTVSFAIEDVAAATARVRDGGGQIVVEPRPIEDYGVLAGCLDPEGVFFTLWQPGTRGCAELTGRSNTWAWTALFTRAPEQAEAFYLRVFGWGRARESLGVRWTAGGAAVAAMIPIGPNIPKEALADWLPHFGVADVQETTDRALALGGIFVAEYEDPVYGRAVSVTDPQDAQFVLIRTP